MVGLTREGLPLYRFKYTWSDLNLVGVMAQDVLRVAPEAVSVGSEGYYRVDYGKLGLRLLTYERWLEGLRGRHHLSRLSN